MSSTSPRLSGNAPPRRLALISEHGSPLARPDMADCDAQRLYVGQVARALGRAGYQVDVFTRRDAAGQRQVQNWHPGVRLVQVPAGPVRVLPSTQLLPCMHDFARFVVRFARRQAAPYRLAHANSFMSGMVAHHLQQVLGLPFVMRFHALGRVRRPAQGLADAFAEARLRIEAALMRQANRLVATCPQDRRDLEQRYGAAPAHMHTIPCGFDPQELGPVARCAARARLGLSGDGFVILQLGRLAPRKGFDTAIQSLALLRRSHGIPARLLVVGGAAAHAEDGASAELARLRALSSELGVGQWVHFPGPQPRAALRDWYGAADVVVATPWHATFGMTTVEAMACARPVIGAAIGGIQTTVVNHVTGYLVPPRDPPAIAAHLAALQRAPAHAAALGEAGQRRAERHYTWQTVAQQLMAVYSELGVPQSLPHPGKEPPP